MLLNYVSRACMYQRLCKRFCTSNARLINTYSTQSQLETICKTIRYSGPISVAQYMKTVLTNSNTGYYIHKDMLGAEGDFVTSPELNQIFGELVGIWFVSEWKAMGSPSDIDFVELGPGRGTLASDVVRLFQHFRQKVFGESKLSFRFVEVSETLSKLQYDVLCGTKLECAMPPDCYQAGYSKIGHFPMYWYRDLDSVPNDKFAFFLAHEFFDALPIHKFVKGKNGWRELYVDVKSSSENELQFVLLPEVTIATKLIKSNETRNHVEVCPMAGSIVSNIAKRIEANNGGALIIDYGHLGEKEDTLRGFKDHKLNDIFDNIGEADITADVDFQFICDSVKDHGIETNGPVIQQDFLKNMGIEVRLMMLLRNCKDKKQAQKLIDSYKIIMDEEQMGERFKVLALTGKREFSEEPVTGFYDS